MSYPVYNGLRVAGPPALQWVGVALAVVALPFVLLAGISATGYAIGAGLYLGNFLVALAVDRFARGQGEVTAIGITSMAFISRAWVTVGLLFVTNYVGDRRIALTAGIAFIILFTIGLMVRAVGAMIARGHAMEGPV